MTDARLIFPETWQLDGFTTNVTSRQAGEPDPVIRELLQNSLDAAVREAKRERAEVNFTIAKRRLSQLPGINEYVDAFQEARKELPNKVTNDVRSAVRRIEAALSKAEVDVMFCRDNGVGLDPVSMQALLSEGQSHKPTAGAGSYGLGHLTAYPASDLRYVLYAGKRDGAEIASGHAILASHMRGHTRYSAHGFWRTPTDVFSLEDGNFPKVAPPLLRPEMDRIDGSGSVVAITGFNYFHEDQPKQALNDVCRVAALNFLGAILEGKMIVQVHDESTGQSETVDAGSLQHLLAQIRNQQRAPAAGWLPGQQGYRAWQTLADGSTLDTQIDRSVRVIFRALAPNSSERSRVQIFRDGMWITNREPELSTGAFGGVQPFDAVVLLSDADPDDHTEFYDLVRNSEGPEHRGLTKRRELPKPQRDQLREMLRTVAERLKEAAGAVDATEGFSPAGFAVFNTGAHRQAAPVPRLRHRPIVSESDEPATDSTGVPASGPSAPSKDGKRMWKRHHRRAPAGGTALQMRRSVVPQLEADNTVRRLRAEIKLGEPVGLGGTLGLRVFVESGSDESCEQPLGPVWQSLRAVRLNSTTISGEDEPEVVIPNPEGHLEIELSEPVSASARFELEVVRRRTKGSTK